MFTKSITHLTHRQTKNQHEAELTHPIILFLQTPHVTFVQYPIVLVNTRHTRDRARDVSVVLCVGHTTTAEVGSAK